jgi:hypothetical protein
MKINKITSALVAMGIVSLASAANANTVIYLTGSTAARAIIYSACTTSGQVFSGTSTVVSGNNSSGASQIVYEGAITGITGTVDIDCDFTGSEAGIAAVAGQNDTTEPALGQSVNGGTYSLPGIPPSFLTEGSSWATASTLPIAGGVSTPDLTMADTSQAVSLTPTTVAALHSFGIVGVIPFTFMKGYEKTPDSTWTNVVNVTTPTFNAFVSNHNTANYFTGNTNDVNDYVLIVGRNKGSGTRVNALLNAAQYPIGNSVDQFAYGSYPVGSGTLTFSGSYAAGQGIFGVGNDGFDSGGGVQSTLNVDSTVASPSPSNPSYVLVGYLGISDAAHAYADNNTGAGGSGSATGSGPAAFLTFNGVYESDAAVESGAYTFWGSEHLYGAVTPSAIDTTVGQALASGIATNLISSKDGLATGALGPVYTAQSIVIPTALMSVSRDDLDNGFPVPVGPGNFNE